MKLFRYILAAALLVIAGIASAQTTDTLYTLQQCIDIAIKNNLDVRKSELQMEADRVYWNQARENLLPAINANVNHTIYNGRSLDPTTYSYVTQQNTSAQYNLNGTLTVFNGLALINGIKQTSLAYQAGKLDFQQAKNDITLTVITTYLQVLQALDQLSSSAQQIEVSQQTVNRAETLNKEGSIAPSDLSDLRGQLADNKLSLITARNSMYVAKLNLLQTMNVPYNRDVKLERLKADELPGVYNQTAEQVYQTALNTLPLVKSNDLKYESSQKAVSAAKGYYYPSVSLGSGLNSNYSSLDGRTYGTQIGNNYSYYFGVGINIPILNYFKTRNNVALTKINMLTARATTDATKIQVKKNVDQAYVYMSAAYERYQVLRDQVEAYTQSFNAAQVKFNSGVLTSVDFVTIKQRMDIATLNLIGARYDYFIRAKILDYYQGKLNLGN